MPKYILKLGSKSLKCGEYTWSGGRGDPSGPEVALSAPDSVAISVDGRALAVADTNNNRSVDGGVGCGLWDLQNTLSTYTPLEEMCYVEYMLGLLGGFARVERTCYVVS